MSKTDKIVIRDLHLRGIIGINDWERVQAQDILLNLEIFTDTLKAARSEAIEDALNYRTLTKAIIAHVESSRHLLVESLAQEIARISVVEFGADRVKVRVEKPGALRFAVSVGVEIERDASDFEPPS